MSEWTALEFHGAGHARQFTAGFVAIVKQFKSGVMRQKLDVKFAEIYSLLELLKDGVQAESPEIDGAEAIGLTAINVPFVKATCDIFTQCAD